MTTLATASGSLFVTKPAGYGVGAGLGGGGVFRPLWTSGDQTDAYGDHGTSLASISYEQAYMTFPAVHAVVNKIVRQLATMPLKVYRVDGNGAKQRVRADSTEQGSSLAMLLDRPSPRMGPVHFKQWMFLSLLVNGNSLTAKWRGDGRDQPPTELMPAEWSYVNAYAPPGGVIEIWGTTQMGGAERFFRAEDALHFAWMAPCGQLGLSPLKPLADTLRLENAALRTQTATFRNGAKPTGFIVPGDVAQVTPETLKAMRKEVQEMHGGPDQAGKIAALAPGGNWIPYTFDSHQAELLASRVFNRVDVCSVYDTKPPVIGYVEAANFASVREFNLDFYRTLRPWATLGEEILRAQLIDPEPAWQGLQVEFDLREQLRGSPLEEAQRMELEFKVGAATVNDNRDVVNKPRFDEPLADQPWIETNNKSPISLYEQMTLNQASPPAAPGGSTVPA